MLFQKEEESSIEKSLEQSNDVEIPATDDEIPPTDDDDDEENGEF